MYRISGATTKVPLLVFMLLSLAATPVMAGAPLTPHSAVYKIRISVLGGELQTRLQRLGDNTYRAESAIEATGMSRIIARGSIRENSVFVDTNEGMRPLEFQSIDVLSSDHETVDFAFDWDANEVTGFINGQEFNAALNGIVHDRVSLQYGLMHDLGNGVHRDRYALQDAEKFKALSVTNIGTRQVKVPFGKFEAIGVQHRSEGSSRVTTLWCVEELGFLPVIIEQHRKGKQQVRAELVSYVPTPSNN